MTARYVATEPACLSSPWISYLPSTTWPISSLGAVTITSPRCRRPGPVRRVFVSDGAAIRALHASVRFPRATRDQEQDHATSPDHGLLLRERSHPISLYRLHLEKSCGACGRQRGTRDARSRKCRPASGPVGEKIRTPSTGTPLYEATSDSLLTCFADEQARWQS